MGKAKDLTQGQADVPGFRKGKAPPQMVVNHFGKKSITAQACEQIIGSAVPAALQQKNIRVRAPGGWRIGGDGRGGEGPN
eukprot:767904-Hanusia_phi.AAC.2